MRLGFVTAVIDELAAFVLSNLTVMKGRVNFEGVLRFARLGFFLELLKLGLFDEDVA